MEIYEIKNSLPDRCARLWFNPVITWDGKVSSLLFLIKNAEYVMGDLNYDSFREIWNGTKIQNFQKKYYVRKSLYDRNVQKLHLRTAKGVRVLIYYFM